MQKEEVSSACECTEFENKGYNNEEKNSVDSNLNLCSTCIFFARITY